MFKLTINLTFIISLFWSNFSWAENVDLEGFSKNQKWEEVTSEEGLTVYTTEIPNSKLLGFKLTGTVDADVTSLMSNIRDVERSTEWTPELLVKQTIKNISDIEAITYSVNDLPWPLDDRDFILHNKLHLSKDKKLLFVISKSIQHKDYPNKNKLVRAWIHYSNMGLRPLGPNKTYVEWTLFGDPKGNIPAWLVNFYQSGFPIKFFLMARNRANSVRLPMLTGLKIMLNDLNNLLKEKLNKTKDITTSSLP